MKKKILFVLAFMFSMIARSQNITPADLKGAEKSVIITFSVKGDVILASYQVGGTPENRPQESMTLNFRGNTRSQIMLENALVTGYSLSTGTSIELKPMGNDKFAIPKDMAPGTYNFLVNGKTIATNYKVQ